MILTLKERRTIKLALERLKEDLNADAWKVLDGVNESQNYFDGDVEQHEFAEFFVIEDTELDKLADKVWEGK